MEEAQKTVDTLQHQIDETQRKIREYKNAINDVSWRNSYKVPEYASNLAFYESKLGTLEAAKGAADLTLDAAKEVVGVAAVLDPRLAALYASRSVAKVALDAAIHAVQFAQDTIDVTAAIKDQLIVHILDALSIDECSFSSSFGALTSSNTFEVRVSGKFLSQDFDSQRQLISTRIVSVRRRCRKS